MLDSEKVEEALEKRDCMKNKAVETLEQPEDWETRNVWENSGREPMQTAESRFEELWED